MREDEIKDAVREQYAQIPKQDEGKTYEYYGKSI